MEHKRLKVQFPKFYPHLHLPGVGTRTVKTLISATIISIVYALINRNACFACIGAVFGMGGTFRGGLQSGGNRFIGTLIGGLIAIPFYWLVHIFQSPIPDWAWMLVGLFLVLYISQIFSANGGIQPGAVVFYVVLYTVAEHLFVSYTINRIIDTGLGVLLSLIINTIFPSPMEKAACEKEALEASQKETK
ncbi:MAG: hypothetical protein E7335_09770 [Clostridiales bacterium]|nr:hypothetical protein [Clostridiales bacterium]